MASAHKYFNSRLSRTTFCLLASSSPKLCNLLKDTLDIVRLQNLSAEMMFRRAVVPRRVCYTQRQFNVPLDLSPLLKARNKSLWISALYK
jgi:hypothetical protein